ncbi:hypothetical protein HDU76_013894 [Blyttiomyces sp. JEL0837]|nr:hypothetical protein HDU76_013894 [Blyttiomyces sp. JEL0837]
MGPTSSVNFSPDGVSVLSGSDDATMKIWNVESGQELLTLVGHSDRVRSAQYSEDGKLIASGSRDQTVRIWDGETGAQLYNFGIHTRFVYSVCFSFDGTKVLSASGDRSLILLDIKSGRQLQKMQGHSGILCCSLSPDGKMAVSASRDGEISTWDLTADLSQTNAVCGHTRVVTWVRFSPDGKRVASASIDGTIILWDIDAGKATNVLSGHTGVVSSFAWSHDGRKMISAGGDHTARIWDVINTFSEEKVLVGHESSILSVCFGNNGQLAASGGKDETVIVWDVLTGKALQKLTGQTKIVYSLAFANDSLLLASGAGNKNVIVWNLENPEVFKVLEGHTAAVLSVCLSSDASLVASSGRDNIIRIWNAATGEEVKKLEGNKWTVFSVCFSPDNQKLLSASSDGGVREWDIETGAEFAVKLNRTPTSITIYDAHGSRLIESDKDFQDAVEHGYRFNTTAVFLCDGVVDAKDADVKPVVAKTHPEVHSVKVDHVKSSQRIRMDIDDSWTLETFKEEIAKEMELDAATMTLFYMDGDFRVKVKGDQSFRAALKEAESFLVEGSMLVNDEVASVVQAPAHQITQKFIIKVTYETIVYVIEIQTALLDEFNDEFAWNKEDLVSMQLVHGSTIVTSSLYFERTLHSCSAAGTDAEFILRPKVLPSRPSPVSSAPIAPSAHSSIAPGLNENFDVMLSYEWTSGKELVVKIKEELERRDLRVWFDEEQMRANMYERMAEAISKSHVVTPVLTVAYSKSANCKRELSYAGDLKKHIEPTRALHSDEKLEPWAELVTAGLIYYDFSNALNDPIKFNENIESLCNSIRNIIKSHEGRSSGQPTGGVLDSTDPLRKWLQPVDFCGDLDKYRKDYVPGTRKWAVDGVHQWLNDDSNSLLWLNGGAGLGKSIIAFLISEDLPPGFVLGSAFFCKHDDTNKNNAKRIVATIAFELATKLPEFRAFLVSAMEKDTSKVAKGETSTLDMPTTAMKELIINGLSNIKQPMANFVIIVDALDEIGKQGDIIRNDFLNLIRYEVEKLPKWVRVFSTSRPEMDIYQALNGVNSSILLPQDANNIHDIQVFVRHHLSIHLSVEDGFNREQMTELVNHISKKTGGVFHYARLACNSLTERSYRSWDEVMEVANKFDGGLDQIYLQVLEKAFVDVDEKVYERFRMVMGAIVSAREPLHQDTVARFLGLTVAEVGGIILRIQSIISVNSGVIKVLHKSLKDFLSSSERCKNPLFYIDITCFETVMASSSLQIMAADLKRDMANLIDDTVPIPLESSKCINPSLTYSCKFWISHLLASRNAVVLPTLASFCSKSLLYWIEAMTLLGCFSTQLGNQTRLVAKCIAQFDNQTDTVTTQNLLDDLARLIWRFQNAISQNPLQIYSVAVTFTPQETDLFKTYNSDRGSNSAGVFPPDAEWGSHLQYFLGHTTSVSSASFSKDGTKLISSSNDATCRIWDIGTGKEILRLEGHEHFVYNACFSNDGRKAASASRDQSVIIWDANSGKIIKRLKYACAIHSVAFSPDSRQMAIASMDCLVRIVSVATGLGIKELKGHTGPTSSVNYSPDGVSLLSGSDDATMKIWNVESGQELLTLVGHTDRVRSARYSEDGKLIASGSRDQTVRIWDAETGAQLHKFSIHTRFVYSVCFSFDNTKVLSASGDRSLILLDIKSGRQLQSMQGHSGILCCAISPDGKMAVSGSRDGEISTWDITAELSESNTVSGHTKIVTWVKFSPNGKRVASSSIDKTIILFDVETGKATNVLWGHTENVHTVAWSHDGRKLISAGGDNTARIWDVVDTFSQEQVLVGHKSSILAVCFGNNGQMAASGSKDETIIIWDVLTGEALKTLTGHTKIVYSLAFANDSLLLASGAGDKNAILWDLENPEAFKVLEGHTAAVLSVCLSSDSKLVASSGRDNMIRIWNAATGEEVRKLEGNKWTVFSVCFSPDNQKVLSASSDGGVREWDLETGSEVRSMKGSVFNYLCTIGTLHAAFYLPGRSEIFAFFTMTRFFNHTFTPCKMPDTKQAPVESVLTEKQRENLKGDAIQTLIDNELYLRKHPEIKQILEYFMNQVLLNKPKNVHDFATDPELKPKVIRHYTKSK